METIRHRWLSNSNIIDTLYLDKDEVKCAITINGGDVETIPFRQDIIERIIQRRRQILVHSIIYYKFNDNIISDYKWSKWAMELYKLQREHPDISRYLPYAKEFKNFDPSTGYDLPLDDEWGVNKAKQLLEYRDRDVS